MSRRIAVVGGGATGLLAALRLKSLGADVTLLEAAPTAGGAMQSVASYGWLAERGPNTLTMPHPEVHALLTEAGLPEIIVSADPSARKRFLLHHGQPVPLPSRVADLVSSPLLSMSGRLRLLKEPFIERGQDDPEETVDSFVRRRLGPEVADRIIDPYLAGTSGGDPRKLLARFVLPKLVEYERAGGSILKGAMRSRRTARRRGEGGGIWSCAKGLSQLIEAVSNHLGERLRTSTRVSRIVRCEGGFEIAIENGTPLTVDGVVLAVPAPALGTLGVDQLHASDFSTISQMPHASMAVVSLGFRREDVAHPLDGFGLLAATIEQRRILGVLFPSSLFQGRAPDGHVLLTTFIGGGRRPELVGESDEGLLTIVREELREILGANGEARFQDICRWHHTMPQTVAGHSSRLEAAARIETGMPGLVLAGAWREGLAVGEAMLGGVRAADRLWAQAAPGAA